MAKVPLYSTGAASRLPALLLGHILTEFFLVAPYRTGASPVSVRRGTFTMWYGLLPDPMRHDCRVS